MITDIPDRFQLVISVIINEVKVSFAKKKPVVTINLESTNSSVTSKVSELEELQLSHDEQEKLNHGISQVMFLKSQAKEFSFLFGVVFGGFYPP